MAIFIKETIAGGTILAAGIASAIFLSVKAAIQIPFSRYIDSHKDRVIWLWTGTFLIIIVPIQYLFAKNVYSIFIAQIVYGIGAGLASSAWLSLWSTHLDRNHEGFEWSIYSATVGLGTGAAALIGGLLVTYFGFTTTIILMGFLSVIGFVILLLMEYKINNENILNEKIDPMQYHKKHKLLHDAHHR
jgi:MFS family permease